MSQTKAGNLVKQSSLTSFEIEVITGCLIGDGTLSISDKNYRLRVEHTVRHKEYVNWKYESLKRLCVHPPQYVPQHASTRFGTVGHPQLNSLRQVWYQSSKQIPNDLVLTPLMISIWFMDDGTRHRESIDISIHNFSTHSARNFLLQLKTYGIYATVNSDQKGKRLYVKQKSYPVFKKLVKPNIVQCMAYKLP